MKRRVVNWAWEDPDSQAAFADLVGFPDREETSAQVDQIEALLELRPPLVILDIGCGTGRHAIELARRGYAVTGIDVAHTYLAQAKEEAAHQGVDVHFRLQRGTDLSERAAYDLVLAFWHTLGFMSDDEIVEHLGSIRRTLKATGRLLLVLADPKLVPGTRPQPTTDWNETNSKFVLTKTHFEKDIRHERCIVIDTAKDEMVEYHEAHRAFSLVDIQEALQLAGYSPIACLRDLEGGPATPDEFGVFLCGTPLGRS
jgi:SAM-dependent methyltransferase